MRAVQLDSVEAELLRRLRALGICFDHRVDVRLGHARRTDRLHSRLRFLPRRNQHADVPKLRENPPAGRMDLLGNPPPSGQGLRTVEVWNVGIEARHGMIDQRSLGDDQRDAAFRAPAIIGGHIRAWHAVGRERTRHRRHHDAIRKRQAFQLKRPE